MADPAPPSLRLTRRAALAGAMLAAGTAPRAARAANAPAAQPAAPAPGGPPPIGAVFPLAGPLALVGDECLRGVQLAALATGFEAAIHPRDATDQQAAQDAVGGLVKRGGRLFIGTGGSAIAYAATAAAELAGASYVELNAPAEGITTRGFHQLLRIAPTTAQVAACAVAAIAARYPHKRIGLLFNTGATGGAIASAALALWKQAGLQPVLSVAYAENPPDLSEQAARLKRAKVDVVLHAASPDEAPLFFQALADLSWRPGGIFGAGGGYALRENAYAVGDAFSGTFFVGAPNFAPAGPSRAVAETYEARFGTAPRSAHSLTCYTGARLVFEALAAARGDAAKAIASLAQTIQETGTLANGWGLAFDKSGQNTKSFVTLQAWKGGRLAVV